MKERKTTTRLPIEEFLLEMAAQWSTRSTCKRLQVGAILTDKNMMQKVEGYNGNYKGGPNKCDSDEPGNCGCIHAEVNALVKPRNFEAAIMFTTDSPCKACAKLIIQAKVKTVYYKNEYRVKDGLMLLRQNGIVAYKI